MFEFITSIFDTIWNAFIGAMNVVFLPLVNSMDPALFILATAFIVSFIINLATKFLVNQDRMAEIKEEMQAFQKKAKAAGRDPERMQELQKEQMEMMGTQMEMMKMSFKPMIYTWVPIIAIFAYLRYVFDVNGVYHLANPAWNGAIVELPLIISKILFIDIWHWVGGIFYKGGFEIISGTVLGWLGWYILCSMGTSMLLRKLMGIK
ncbi:uncharacterized membrane protein (DUF106 family) [Methanococcus voltae]|nr:EMC3/TMCO1 family protein [Methanococcus voltae]MBP2144127.1 uncharacterized membrane protein (DUF106 family) [Methanococcus voltae]